MFTHNKISTNIKYNCITIVPVSYTHLDVYKRQRVYTDLYCMMQSCCLFASLHLMQELNERKTAVYIVHLPHPILLSSAIKQTFSNNCLVICSQITQLRHAAHLIQHERVFNIYKRFCRKYLSVVSLRMKLRNADNTVVPSVQQFTK